MQNAFVGGKIHFLGTNIALCVSMQSIKLQKYTFVSVILIGQRLNLLFTFLNWCLLQACAKLGLTKTVLTARLTDTNPI